MAEVILKNIKKIYPHQEPKKKKKGEPEKKNNLQITEEGVLAVDNFNPVSYTHLTLPTILRV